MDVSERSFENPEARSGIPDADTLRETTEGAQILDELVTFLERFVVMTSAHARAVALWVVHTHLIDACEQSPILAVTSAEKRCGKTRLLDVLELLVARPWRVIMPSEAVVFRKIDADQPTLLLDEVDAIFNPRANGATEGLRALLNAGNRPWTKVPRCVGPSQNLVSFSVFCAKAVAGIRELPDTVADRAVCVRLKRRAPGEPVERFRRRDIEAGAETLYENVRNWAEANAPALREARPALPDELDDRAQDAWEPLLSIADLARGNWPERARNAALTLASATREDESERVRLLSDVRAIFRVKDADRLSSAGLAAELHEIEESPWGEWHGKPISTRGVAKLLKYFEIRPRSVRFEDGTTAKGYLREQFEDAFTRYLPSENVTTSQPAPLSGKQTEAIRHTPELVTDGKGSSLAPAEGCDRVTDKTPDHGDGEVFRLSPEENERAFLAACQELVDAGEASWVEPPRPTGESA